jgi:iron complex outermembrane receptor protein
MRLGKQKTRARFYRGALLASAGLAAIIAGLAPPAAGQTLASNTASGDTTTVEEIVVTGTRIARPGGYSAPTPVTVVTAERLQETGATNIGDLLNQLPAFRASSSRTLEPSGTAPGSLTADLRGMGPARTLVLVDGRRFVPSTPLGSVDLNLIPTVLVERAEVVTGGASAAYGADAVAGVVNFILDTGLTGIKSQVQYGQTELADDKRYQGSLAAGTDLFGGRAHIVAAAEYEDDGGTGDVYTRGWGRTDWGGPVNPAFGKNGLPASFLAAPSRSARASTGGLITAGPLRGTAFAADGSPTTFTFGQFGTPTTNSMIGGGEPNHLYFVKDFPMAQPVRRYNLFSHLSFDVTSGIKGFFEASYGNVKASDTLKTVDQGNITIHSDNAYLPASVQSAILAAGLQTFSMGRLNEDLEGRILADRSTYRLTTGAKGGLGGSWSWQTYYQYGNSRNEQTWQNNRLKANYALAIDAVRDPNGTIVCRSTLTNPTNGCVPLDLFGVNQFSRAARAYVLADGHQEITFQQHAASFSVQGEPLRTWADAVTVAAGVEYRKDEINGTADPLSLANAFSQLNAANLNGSIAVTEGFMETVVPLAENARFAKSLELNGAVRETHYSTSGSVSSWKAGLIYEPVEAIRLRVTHSRDIRAPNATELFSPSQGSFIIVRDPSTNTQPSVTVFAAGNPNVKPEKADTVTGGVVFRPPSGILRGLQLSVDYYAIDLNSAIGKIGAGNIIERCFKGATELCGLITRDSSGLITQVEDHYLNFGSLKATGMDFDATYSLALADIGRSLRGRLDVQALATHAIKLTTTDSAGSLNRAGQVGAITGLLSAPKWTADGIVTYSNHPVSLSVQGHFVAAGTWHADYHDPSDPAYNTTTDRFSVNMNHVPSVFYLNLSGRYDIGAESSRLKTQVYAGVENVLNKDPPPDPSQHGGANPQYYDVLGRRFFVGVNMRL